MMQYKINYKISGNFLKVALNGSYPLEKFGDISADMDKVINENGISKILVDLRKFEGRFGVFDGLRHIEKFPEESRFRKFAVLDVEKNKQNNDFFENASYNRGFNLLFFYNESEALKWLEVENFAEAEKVLVREL